MIEENMSARRNKIGMVAAFILMYSKFLLHVMHLTESKVKQVRILLSNSKYQNKTLSGEGGGVQCSVGITVAGWLVRVTEKKSSNCKFQIGSV